VCRCSVRKGTAPAVTFGDELFPDSYTPKSAELGGILCKPGLFQTPGAVSAICLAWAFHYSFKHSEKSIYSMMWHSSGGIRFSTSHGESVALFDALNRSSANRAGRSGKQRILSYPLEDERFLPVAKITALVRRCISTPPICTG